MLSTFPSLLLLLAAPADSVRHVPLLLPPGLPDAAADAHAQEEQAVRLAVLGVPPELRLGGAGARGAERAAQEAPGGRQGALHGRRHDVRGEPPGVAAAHGAAAAGKEAKEVRGMEGGHILSVSVTSASRAPHWDCAIARFEAYAIPKVLVS